MKLKRPGGPKPKLWRGYRNCAKCTRWRPVSDFPVFRTRTGYEQIKSECDYCKRQRENLRYQRLTPEQKEAKGKKANEWTAKRRNKALNEITRLHKILDKQNEKLEKQWDRLERAKKQARPPRGTVNGTAVDIVPFRMWLLRQYRQHGYNASELAAEIGQDERQVRRWLDGYEWRGVGFDPQPILAVNIKTIDKVSIAFGDPSLLARLYPLEVDDD